MIHSSDIAFVLTRQQIARLKLLPHQLKNSSHGLLLEGATDFVRRGFLTFGSRGEYVLTQLGTAAVQLAQAMK